MGRRENVINLLGGGNSITSSYSAMQSVVQGDVTGHQAESRGCLHFKPNFQFSPPIFLHSHWRWKLSMAHLCEEGGREIKGKLLFRSLTSYLFNLHYLNVGMGTVVWFIFFGAPGNVRPTVHPLAEKCDETVLDDCVTVKNWRQNIFFYNVLLIVFGLFVHLFHSREHNISGTSWVNLL